ncbi:MAG: CDP-glucose 4,6-dehydratase [Chitinophagaceae bacterium]|nr:MAG: CDP-glucose 4,6-dehydratase [Chitinophagaceae bacterium]
MEKLVMKNKLQNFYKDKKVFVTGHTGFKGSWLCEILLGLGAEVYGYALAPDTDPNHFTILGLSSRMESEIADIRHRETLQDAVLDFQPDYIFHLAAQPLVRRSYSIPAETFDTNVTGTANLLEALTRLSKKCAVVVVTTDKVYENNETGKSFLESDRLGGYDPYSASKACTELVVQSFRLSFFNDGDFSKHKKIIGSARAGNVIGGGDFSEDRLVPDVIKTISGGKMLKLRFPDSVRPWQHVLEPLCGYLFWGGLMYTGEKALAESINFGPEENDHLSVQEVVESAIKYFGKGSWEKDTAENHHEAGLLKLNISLAKKVLNWHPKMNSKEAIQKSLEWYSTPDEEKAQKTREQIDQYLSA